MGNLIYGYLRWLVREGEVTCQRKLLNHSISMHSFRHPNEIVSPCEKYLFLPSARWLINWLSHSNSLSLSPSLFLFAGKFFPLLMTKRKSLRKSIKQHYLLRIARYHTGDLWDCVRTEGSVGSSGSFPWYLLRFITELECRIIRNPLAGAS